MDYKRFDKICKKLIDAYKKLDDEAYYVVQPKASEEEISGVEKELGIKIPAQLRNFFKDFSAEVEMRAFLPHDFCDALPKELCEIFCACFIFSLEELKRAEESRRNWVEACFTDPEDEYDNVWYGKLGIMTVANGDVIALDIRENSQNPSVVYLSHDDGEGHGAVLGKDFEAYLMNLVQCGACGEEDWQMLPFMPDMENGIDSECENAKEYRRLICFDY